LQGRNFCSVWLHGGARGRESVLGEVLLHLTCSRELETRNTSDKKERKEKKRNMGMKLVFYLTYCHPGNKHSFLLLPILTSCRGQLWVMDLTAIDKKVKEQTWSAMFLTTCISEIFLLLFLVCLVLYV
jgi:hypothetical protein